MDVGSKKHQILTLYIDRWIGLVLITTKTYDNHMYMCVRQTDKPNKIVQREHISLRTKLVASLGIINAIALE